MIQINNLAFSYGSTEVLRNISMNLEPGRIYGLLGENGVGRDRNNRHRRTRPLQA